MLLGNLAEPFAPGFLSGSSQSNFIHSLSTQTDTFSSVPDPSLPSKEQETVL